MAKIEKIRVMEMDLARETEARDYMRTQVENAARRARGMVFCLFNMHFYFYILLYNNASRSIHHLVTYLMLVVMMTVPADT